MSRLFLGPPQGWIEVDDPAGEKPARYTRADGKHKNKTLCDVFKILAGKEAKDEAWERYMKFVDRDDEAKAKAAEKFREVHGDFSKFCSHMPGWTVATTKRGVKNFKVYTGPDGRKYRRLADVEAEFGKRVLNGEDLTAMVERAQALAALDAPQGRKRQRPPQAAAADAHPEAPAPEGRAAAAAGGPPAEAAGEAPRAAGARTASGAPPSAASGPAAAAAAAAKRRRDRVLRWRRLAYGHRRRPLLYVPPGADPQGADARLGRRLADLPQYARPKRWAQVPLHGDLPPRSEEEHWLLGHPLWIKIARRGYPLPISEREILALRSYVPMRYGGLADPRYF